MLEQDYASFLQIYITGIVLTLFITGICFLIFLRKSFLVNWAQGVFIVSIIFYSTYILVFQILKLYTFKYYADFSVWLELFSNIINGRGIITTLQQTSLGFGNIENYFAQHFVPLIYI